MTPKKSPFSRLQLFTGRAGVGKTSKCLHLFREKILHSAQSGLNEPSYFILPSQEHGQRIRDLLLRDKRLKGVLNFHVLTISDFMSFKVRKSERRTHSHFERAWIARKLLEDGQWAWLGRAKESKGLPYLVADFIREVKAGCLNASQFARISRKLAERDPYFAAKGPDLVRLVERYEAFCAQKGSIDAEDEIAEFSRDMIRRRSPPFVDFVIFDGFFSFTESQLLFVRAISKAARRVIVTLTLDHARLREDLFRLPLDTRRRLLQVGFCEVPMANRRLRFRSKELALLEQNLWSLVRPEKPEGSPMRRSVEIFEASGIGQEIEMIAREILEKQRTEGHHFSDFMIVLRDLGPYRDVIEEAFGRLGIPYEVHERSRLSDSRVVRFLLLWVKLFGVSPDPWGQRLMDLVGSGYLKVDLSVVEEIRTALTGPMEMTGSDALKVMVEGPSVSPAVREFLALLVELMESYRRLDTWKALRDFYAERLIPVLNRADPAAEDSSAKQEAIAFEKFDQLLNRLATQETPSGFFPLAEMNERLQAMLETALYSVRRVDKNRVQVYDVSLALPKEYRSVFVAGLCQGRFPRRHTEGPILRDTDREFLNAALARNVFDTSLWRADGERFFFYMAATRARSNLYFTYARSDADGREILPSFFIDEARRALGDRILERKWHLKEIVPEPDRLLCASDLLKLFSFRAFRGAADPLIPTLASVITEDSQIKKALSLKTGKPWEDLMDKFRGLSAPVKLTDPEFLEEFESRPLQLSANRIEKLRNCGYQHFAHYTLGLRETEKPAGRTQDGNVLHKVLEDTYRYLAERGESGREDAKTLRNLLWDRLEGVFGQFPVEREKSRESKARKFRLRKWLTGYAAFEEERRALFPGFVPRRFEWRFGGGEGEDPVPTQPLTVQCRDRAVYLQGRLDRIDVSSDGVRALVVDYKSGHNFTLKGLKAGEEIQAPIYLLAVRQLLGLELLGIQFVSLSTGKSPGVFRKSAAEDTGAARSGILSDCDFDEFLARSQTTVLEAAEKLGSGDIRAESQTCEYCRYNGLCRFEGWKWKRR